MKIIETWFPNIWYRIVIDVLALMACFFIVFIPVFSLCLLFNNSGVFFLLILLCLLPGSLGIAMSEDILFTPFKKEKKQDLIPVLGNISTGYFSTINNLNPFYSRILRREVKWVEKYVFTAELTFVGVYDIGIEYKDNTNRYFIGLADFEDRVKSGLPVDKIYDEWRFVFLDNFLFVRSTKEND